MRRSGFILAFAALLWLVGCQEKSPVELALDQSTATLEVKVLPAVDSTLIVDASVDTSGVMQQEEQLYPATFLVNGVKTDLGASRSTFSYSRILLNDKKKPISGSGKVVGYLGLDVGTAKVNAVDLPKTMRPYRTGTSFYPDQNAGSAYTLVDQDNQPIGSFTYASGQTYRFVADGRGSVTPFELAIASPEEITVLEPKAGSVVFKNDDLQVRWSGKVGGTFRVLISSFDARSNVPVKPLLQIEVIEGSNSLTVPAKVLKSLQANSDGRYLFSFISMNRSVTSVPGYTGNVLVQAASIHNIQLWVK
ncbi:MAG: hypothetical protein NTZ35_10905 [Ignavibacteriales bacterium]|nr:hypothetical protein [Ignavibacteriales bacterium]